MLDESLPTFLFRPMPDTPSSAVVYFTRSGSDPTPEYVLRRADPVSKPACHGLYAAALTDPYNCSDVVYGEVAVGPQWQQPTLSSAELRGRQGSDPTAAAAAAPIAKVPDTFSVQLYDPDQTVSFRWTPRSWNKMESWEFDVPTQSFRLPSASRLDREPTAAAAAMAQGAGPSAKSASSSMSPAAAALQPRSTFRWKRDGRLGNKDMTCYLVGKSTATYLRSSSSSSKEPDITIALFKHGRDPALTIYEPNMHRVDVQDRKGLELLLILGAEVIRDLYLVPLADPFNLEGAPAAAATAAGRRQNSHDAILPPLSQQGAASTSMHNVHNVHNGRTSTDAATTPSAAAIDAETKRLQALLEREERERVQRVREEEKRIKKMLEAEEKERRQRDAEVAKETERLRKMYGVEGQDLPSDRHADVASGSSASYRPPPPPPPPPPATATASAPVSAPGHAFGQPLSQNHHSSPHLPPRPVSVGPLSARPGASTTPVSYGRTGNSGVSGFLASLSSSAHRSRLSAQPEDERSRIHKKRSVHF